MHLNRLIFRLLSKMCLYANPAFIHDFTVVRFDFALAWKFCRYSRIVVISTVVISEVDCSRISHHDVRQVEQQNTIR